MKKRILSFLLALLTALSLTACGRSYDKIELGDNLPTIEFSETHRSGKLPDDTKEQNLTDVYTTENEAAPDVYVYRYEKAEGETLDSFGAAQAEEHKVFCNMTEYAGVPAANVTYYQKLDGRDYIVRSFIFEDEAEFVKLCFMHKTKDLKLGQSALSFKLMSGYSSYVNKDSVFPFEEVYEYEDEYLPTVRVRRCAKDYFTADKYDESLIPGTSKEHFEAYAVDGWSLDDVIAVYGENYELLKGEKINRNGFDIAFIGYIDAGIFYVRAYIDYGNEYIVLCAENDAPHFQHVVNALIDTISQ